MRRLFRSLLDGCWKARKALVTSVAFITLWLYGSEVGWRSLWTQKLPSPARDDLDLRMAREPQLLLQAARDAVTASEKRRNVVLDKSKTLLTIASFVAGVIGVIAPKSAAFPALWLKILFYVAALALMNTIVMLLEMISVRTAMIVTIGPADVQHSPNQFSISLARSYFSVHADAESQTDYITEIYKGARFSFLCAFTMIALLFTVLYFWPQPNYQAIAVAKELRSDAEFVRQVRGEKGEHGEKGDTGERGEQGERGEKGDPGATPTAMATPSPPVPTPSRRSSRRRSP